MNDTKAFQDQIPDNHCFGCGPHNENGLRIKSYWLNEGESICRFMPASHHAAGPHHYLNGGIISTLIDCHGVCTAIATRYAREGREIGAGERIWFVTGALEVSYKKPTPIDHEVVLKATVMEEKEKKITVMCTLSSQGSICAEGKVVAIKAPSHWFH